MVWVTVDKDNKNKVQDLSYYSDQEHVHPKKRSKEERKKFLKTISVSFLTFGVITLGGCSSTSELNKYGVKTSERVYEGKSTLPKVKGYYKVGKPYKVAGKWYHPKENKSYNKSGVGSWYGDDFHGRKTANGEVFDMHAMTAAHKTLPMPSLVRVTNLTNGKKIIVRVNDRGPYHDNRIIDLSRAAATALDYQHKGIAKVRVEYLGKAALDPNKDKTLIASYKGKGGGSAANPKRSFVDHVFGWNKPKFVPDRSHLTPDAKAAVIKKPDVKKLSLTQTSAIKKSSLKVSDMQEFDPDVKSAVAPQSSEVEALPSDTDYMQVAMFKDAKQAIDYKKNLGSSVTSKIDIEKRSGKNIYLVMVKA